MSVEIMVKSVEIGKIRHIRKVVSSKRMLDEVIIDD